MSGITGFPTTAMLTFDQVIIDLMNSYYVPGAALAVSRDGTIIIERGYGLLDLEDLASQVTVANSFRIASISKTITAMTILKLIEQNSSLILESFVWELLKGEYPLLPGESLAPGVDQIRIVHLLQHSAGWDDSVYDPMFDVDNIAKQVGMPAPADQRAIVRSMWSRPLVNNPGSKFAYSNFHYCLLGRVIEHVTGQGYADFVASSVLGPLGMSTTFQAASFLSGRRASEARYYPYPDEPQEKSVFPPFNLVDAPYGSFDIENMDSHGGWVSSPLDMVAFINGVFRNGFLSPASINSIAANQISTGAPGESWGLGWGIAATTGGFNLFHNGALPGSTSIAVRTIWSDGSEVCWTALTNTRDGGRTGGPSAVGNSSVSVFGEQQHIAYRDGDGKIQDAWYDSGNDLWSLQQINQGGVTNGPSAAGDPFVSVFEEQQHFVYRDGAGAIQDAWYDSGTNKWTLQRITMSGKTAGASAAGDPFVSVFGEQQHFVYRDGSGAIQDAWYDAGSNKWNLERINLSGKTRGPAAAGDPFVSVFGEQQHFVYRDSNGTIQDAWYDSGGNRWGLQQINLGGLTTGPAAGGDPQVSVYGTQQHFVYCDAFGGLWDAWYDGDSDQWDVQQLNVGELTNAPLAASDPSVSVYEDQQHVVYPDASGTVWDVWFNGATSTWNLQQLNRPGGVTNGPPATGKPSSWPDEEQQHFTWRDGLGTIWDAWYDSSTNRWSIQQINRQGRALVDALDAAMWTALKSLPALP